MDVEKKLFYKKKFLIYGYGKSGFASFKYLNANNDCKIFDLLKTLLLPAYGQGFGLIP
mgnify:CR=1 FL=1